MEGEGCFGGVECTSFLLSLPFSIFSLSISYTRPTFQETYISHARLHLPTFPLAYIGFSLLHAARFLSDDHPDVHFNLFQATLVGPLGARFRRAARARGRKIFVWTVNEVGWMEWCVRKGVDGVITDDVGRYREVREWFGGRGGGGKGVGWPGMVGLYARAAVLQAMVLVFSVVFWHRLSGKGRRKVVGGTAAEDGKTGVV